MKLQKILNIKGTIHLLTALHIGAGKDSIEIGGLDLPIMKNPRTKEPYIPGSSFKGKMRSLLEVTELMGKEGQKPIIKENGEPCGCGSCLVCDMFGAHKARKEVQEKMLPTRLLMRDAELTEEFQFKNTQNPLQMEVKYENTINRITGTAENPRPVERVPAGVEFSFDISLKVFEGDNEEKFKDILKMGLKLIELDALGGHSSRGSGQVRFDNVQCDGEDFKFRDISFK